MKMRYPNAKLLTIAILAWVAPLSAAQVCQSNLSSTAPANDFEFLAGGEVRHKVTGLQWRRCYEGYTFNDNGSPSNYTDDFCVDDFFVTNVYNWQAALTRGTGGWRLPNMKELRSILEYSCRNPAVNISVFPAIPAPLSSQPEIVWSSTPVAKVSDRAWALRMDEGGAEFGISAFINGSSFYVRLVR